MRKKRAAVADAGLQAIADLERTIVEAREHMWRLNGVSEVEITRELPAVMAVAKAVCARLREEYLERQCGQP